MASDQRCVNGTLDGSSYSSPVPVIGLYVAAATSVCFLFILFDILSGFRNRKRWLPCRLFSLNSITLTLISIAAKIPVDLTTTMPSTHDQLSKLTGTTLICICMGFLMPSLGTNRGSECWTNMAALTILVVTVVVNICIQMHTGVIVLFKVEHIMIMCCMLLLLLALWCFAYDIDIQKKVSLDQNKDLFTKGKGSMSCRLKLCYLYAYDSNPQLELCRDVDNVLLGFLSLFSSAVVVQAAFRSIILKELKLCDDVSDYKWSIGFTIVTQIATILIGSFGTSFRWLTLAPHMDMDSVGMTWATKDVDDVILKNPKVDKMDRLIVVLVYAASLVVLSTGLLVSLPFAIVREICTSCCCCCSMCKSNDEDSEGIQEFEELTTGEGKKKLDKWTLKKGVKDMKKGMQVNKVNHVFQLISETHPSQESLTKQLKNSTNTKDQAYEVSSLSVVLLVKIIAVSIPSPRSESLTEILNEVFEVIHFIEKKMNSTSYKKIAKSMLAKATWVGEDFTSLLPKITNEEVPYESSLDKAIRIIGGLKDTLPSDIVWDELGIITEFIKQQSCGSIEELLNFAEQLFIDMLNEFFIQLPNAIYKDIMESRPEDFEEIIRFSLKTICRVESLEGLIQWSYPIGTNITNLISDTVFTINHERSTSTRSIEHSNGDEIIQVE